MKTLVLRIGLGCIIPLNQQLMRFDICQYRQRMNTLTRVRKCHALQNLLKMCTQTLYRVRGKILTAI